MSQEQVKVPLRGGLDEARRKLKEMRKKEPTSNLIKIIDEVTQSELDKKPEADPRDIAAKPQHNPDSVLDL